MANKWRRIWRGVDDEEEEDSSDSPLIGTPPSSVPEFVAVDEISSSKDSSNISVSVAAIEVAEISSGSSAEHIASVTKVTVWADPSSPMVLIDLAIGVSLN